MQADGVWAGSRLRRSDGDSAGDRVTNPATHSSSTPSPYLVGRPLGHLASRRRRSRGSPTVVARATSPSTPRCSVVTTAASHRGSPLNPRRSRATGGRLQQRTARHLVHYPPPITLSPLLDAKAAVTLPPRPPADRTAPPAPSTVSLSQPIPAWSQCSDFTPATAIALHVGRPGHNRPDKRAGFDRLRDHRLQQLRDHDDRIRRSASSSVSSSRSRKRVQRHRSALRRGSMLRPASPSAPTAAAHRHSCCAVSAGLSSSPPRTSRARSALDRPSSRSAPSSRHHSVTGGSTTGDTTMTSTPPMGQPGSCPRHRRLSACVGQA